MLGCAAAGARVAFTWKHRAEDADETLRQLQDAGAEALSIRADAAVRAEVDAAVAAVVSAWGGLDGLVNNAGHTQIMPFALLEEADWDATMDVYAKGAYLHSRAALRPMIRQRGGVIVHVGSFAAERGAGAPVHYAAAKGAVAAFSRALAAEVARYGVRVNLVAPGLLDVGLGARLPPHRVADFTDQSALGRRGTADEVAAAVVFLLSDAAAGVTGAPLAVDGGL